MGVETYAEAQELILRGFAVDLYPAHLIFPLIHSTLTHPTTYSQRVDDESSLQAYQVTVTYRATHVLGLE